MNEPKPPDRHKAVWIHEAKQGGLIRRIFEPDAPHLHTEFKAHGWQGPYYRVDTLPGLVPEAALDAVRDECTTHAMEHEDRVRKAEAALDEALRQLREVLTVIVDDEDGFSELGPGYGTSVKEARAFLAKHGRGDG